MSLQGTICKSDCGDLRPDSLRLFTSLFAAYRIANVPSSLTTAIFLTMGRSTDVVPTPIIYTEDPSNKTGTATIFCLSVVFPILSSKSPVQYIFNLTSRSISVRRGHLSVRSLQMASFSGRNLHQHPWAALLARQHIYITKRSLSNHNS